MTIIKTNRISSKATIGKDVVMGTNVLIEDNVIIRDNCTIGDNVVLAKGAIVRAHVRIGSGSRIGRYSDVYERVLIDENVRVFVRSKILRHSRIGRNVVVGADATVDGELLDNVNVPSNSIIKHTSPVTENVQVYSNGTLSLTLFETVDGGFIQGRNGEARDVATLTVERDATVYRIAKCLLPQYFGGYRKLLNKLLT